MCESNLTKESGSVKPNIATWESLCKKQGDMIDELMLEIDRLKADNWILESRLSDSKYDNKDRDEDAEEAISDGDLSDMAHEAHL